MMRYGMLHSVGVITRRVNFLLIVLMGCSMVSWGQEGRLVGTWQGALGDVALSLRLKDDGTGTLNGEGFRYAVRGRKIVVEDDEGEISAYDFSLEGDSLTISGGKFPRAVTFTRSGESGRGRRGASSSARKETERAEDDGLTGTWRSDAATVQVFDDGHLTINGERFRYSVEGDTITLSNAEGSAKVQFQLKGETLLTNYNGMRTVYRRVRGGAGREAGRESEGANPPELFGKWCYMSNVNASNGGRMSNTCFTLNADGTYDYYSETSSSGPNGGSASQERDSGTWSVSGNTLVANSRAHGRQIFRLEKRNHPKTGDPMLVLDGDAFVTYSPRQPWP